MGGKAADEIHAQGVGGPVHRLGDAYEIFRRRAPGDQRHRRQILHRVIIELHDRRIEHGGLRMPDAHRVAVGRCMRDAADADTAAGAADILDDDRLAERHLHLLRQDAGDGVGRSAGRIGHHDGDGA